MENKNILRLIYKALHFKGAVKNQAEFGEKLGYKEAFTSKLLNGRQKFPDDLGKKVSHAFGEDMEKWEKEYEMFGDTMEKTFDDLTDLTKAFRKSEEDTKKPASDDTGEIIALLRQVAEAERTARIEAQKRADATEEAKEAFKEIARLKEAPSSDAFYKRLEDRDEKLQSLLEQALPLLGGLHAGLSAVQEHGLLLNDTFEWIEENLSSEEALRDMWKNHADRIRHDLNKSLLRYREEQRQDTPSLQGS